MINVRDHAIPYLTPYAKIENLVSFLRVEIDQSLDRRVTIIDAQTKLAVMSEN